MNNVSGVLAYFRRHCSVRLRSDRALANHDILRFAPPQNLISTFSLGEAGRHQRRLFVGCSISPAAIRSDADISKRCARYLEVCRITANDCLTDIARRVGRMAPMLKEGIKFEQKTGYGCCRVSYKS